MKLSDAATPAEGLDRAIDELLAIRVAVSPRPVGLPDLALDAALRDSPRYQKGRRVFAGAIESLLDGPWEGLPQAVLDVESAANLMVGRAVEVAFQLGLRSR